MTEVSRRRQVFVAVFVVALSAAVIGSAAFGLDLWVPIGMATLPWLLLLADRFGSATGLALSVIILLFAVLLLMAGTAAIGAPLVLVFTILSVAVGIVGAGAMFRLVRCEQAQARRLFAATGPAVGAVVWLAVVVASRIIPGSGAYGWVMSNDSANNMLFARTQVAAAGIRIGSGENPVPLPAAMLALGMASGRGAVSSDALLAHDLTAFVGVWTATICLLCVLVGVVVSMSISVRRAAIRWVIGALASVLRLTWFVVGYPIEYGFFNAHVALVIALASWIVFRRLESRPAVAWGVLALSCTILLAVWSPLVLLPAGLMLVVLIQSRRSLWRPAHGRLVAIAGTSQLLVFGLFVTTPSLVAQARFLAAGGAAYPFAKWPFILMLAATAAVAVLGFRRFGSRAALGVIAQVVACVLAFGALVFAARSTLAPLSSYYPAKLQWLATVFLVVIFLEWMLGLVAQWFRRRFVLAVAVVITTAAVAQFVQIAPDNATGYPRVDPLRQVLKGALYGPHDETAQLVLRFANDRAPTILWRSGRPDEGYVNFWVLEMQAARSSSSLALRQAAYGEYDVEKVADLCHIARSVGIPLKVISADSGLTKQVVSACPSLHIRIESPAALS